MRENHKVDDKIFFIALNSQNTSGEFTINPDNLDLISQLNMNKFYYFYCINIKDYVFQAIDNKGLVTYLCLPKFICIKTYIPCLDLYEQVLRDIYGISVLTQNTSTLNGCCFSRARRTLPIMRCRRLPTYSSNSRTLGWSEASSPSLRSSRSCIR